MDAAPALSGAWAKRAPQVSPSAQSKKSPSVSTSSSSPSSTPPALASPPSVAPTPTPAPASNPSLSPLTSPSSSATPSAPGKAEELSPIVSSHSGRVSNLVLDTAAFIRAVRIERYADAFCTVPEVISEVRDGKARAFLSQLHVDVSQRSPSASAMAAVTAFAKATGDYASLSLNDLRVLALTYSLDVEAHGGTANHLRTEPPKPLVASDSNVSHNYFNPLEDSSDEDDDEEDSDDEDSDSDIHVDDKAIGHVDEEGWITPDNLTEYTRAFEQKANASPVTETQTAVACLTADFAMQNVLLQMNLNLVSIDGLRITKARRWVLRCAGCFKLGLDVTKQFCDFCGQHTLEKIAYSVDQDGNVELHLPHKPRNLRGTIYAIPPHKGGRHNSDLIVSQGQMPRQRKKRVKADGDPILELGQHSGSGAQTGPVFGYGRHNPNQARKKFGKKNKSKRRD